MHNIEIIIVLLTIITILSVVAQKIRLSYPILLVIVGIAIGLFPGLPHIVLNPEVVFFIFLPPILYHAAWNTSWPDFRASKRPILLLAFGCVLFTTCGVAVTAHYFIPELGWAEAFVLGAIISPPDAVAATSVTKGLGVPKRVITILEGESLVNDASGLIAYRYAIAAVATGGFVLWEASLQFLLVAVVGVLIGLLIGFIFLNIHKRLPSNSTVDTCLTLLTPYIAYLVSENLHVSGVLAVVTCGLFLNWNSSELFSQRTRLQSVFVWDTAIFILNGIIFILIGLQLPSILERITEGSFSRLIGYGLIISLSAIVLRIMWVYPGTYLPRILSKKIRESEPYPKLNVVSIVAWTGMRGVVSLAAALAIPLTLNNNTPFPNRDLILFLTFSVILVTLILQGLSLPYLIKLLKVRSDEDPIQEENEVRLKLSFASIDYIESNISYGVVSDEVLAQIKTKYEIRAQRIMRKQGKEGLRLDDEQLKQFAKIQEEILKFERMLLIQYRKEAKISDEVLRKLEYELDLEEARLLLDG